MVPFKQATNQGGTTVAIQTKIHLKYTLYTALRCTTFSSPLLYCTPYLFVYYLRPKMEGQECLLAMNNA